jgi:hypothetical protein
MPRVKPNRSSPIWIEHTHALSDEASADLTGLLGFDAAGTAATDGLARALRRVEYWLGFYRGGVRNVDMAPRAADYRATLQPLRKEASALLTKLVNTNGWIRDNLDADGAKLSELEMALAVFGDASRKTLETMATQDSSGRRKAQTIGLVVAELCKVFRQFYRGEAPATRKRRGAFVSRSRREELERQFVVRALTDARIRVPTNLDSLCAASLPADRLGNGT